MIAAFAAAARRAREAGFRIIELHAGHGYLFHQFLSPLSNGRTDRYGGTLDNRARLLMETITAVRGEWPAELPLFVRLSMTDWVAGGWDVPEAVALCRMLKARGDVDLIDCTSGGNDPAQRIPIHPGYQVPFAETVRREAGIPTAAVGLISSPEMAEEIIANGRADLVVHRPHAAVRSQLAAACRQCAQGARRRLAGAIRARQHLLSGRRRLPFSRSKSSTA